MALTLVDPIWLLMVPPLQTPSWQWYYPFHFAPFAADFEDINKMDIHFELGKPFQPFEQLMGVFPAARSVLQQLCRHYAYLRFVSRQHIPAVFHPLMIVEDSPIIDFYPTTFDIDMNGKRMAWQGVALLPFIDQKRLLDAMAVHYPKLTEDEERRNTWGNNAIFTSEEHSLYPSLEALYGKKKKQEVSQPVMSTCDLDHKCFFQPVPIDVDASRGISGSVFPDPDCIPGSTYYSPLVEQGQDDIKLDRSLSAIYLFPKQLSPHRSIVLPLVRRPPRVLSPEDLRGGGGRRGGGGGRGGYGNQSYGNHASTFTNPTYHGPPPPTYNNGRGRTSNDYSQGHASNSSRPPPQQQYGGGYGSGGPRTFQPPPTYGGNSYANGRGAPSRPVSGPYSRGGYHSGPPSRGGYGSGGNGGGGGGYGSGGGSGSYGYGYGGGNFNNTSSYSGGGGGGYSSGSYDGGYSSGRGGAPRGRGRGRGF